MTPQRAKVLAESLLLWSTATMLAAWLLLDGRPRLIAIGISACLLGIATRLIIRITR